MKPLITGLALIIVFSIFAVFQNDNNTYLRQLEYIKYTADECAATANLYYISKDYHNGKKVFNRDECEKAIRDIIVTNLSLNDDLSPLSQSYWTDKITYNVYYYDDSNTIYPFLFTDSLTGYMSSINKPTVIVTITAGRPRFRLNFLQELNIIAIRSSAYEYQN